MGGWIKSLWIPKITMKVEKKKKVNMKYTEASKAITAGQPVFCYLESTNIQKVPLPKRYVLTLTLSLLLTLTLILTLTLTLTFLP